MNRKIIERIILYIIAIFVLILIIAPFYIIFVNAFKSPAELQESMLSLPSEWTLEYMKEALVDMEFLSSFIASFIITVTSVLALTFFPAMLAWQLVRDDSKKSKIIFTIFVMAMLIPFQVLMLPLVTVTDRLGTNGMFTLWIVYLGFGAPLATFMFHGYFKSVPLEMEEAASIDGASPATTFFKIVLPLLQPIIVTIAVLNVMWIWNDYLLPALVLTDVETLPMAIQQFNAGLYGTQYNLMMSAMLAMAIPAIIFYIIAQKYIIEGITAGAVK